MSELNAIRKTKNTLETNTKRDLRKYFPEIDNMDQVERTCHPC